MMKRFIMSGMLVAVFAVFQMSAVAGTPVLTENFDSYTIGNDVTVGSPLTYIKKASAGTVYDDPILDTVATFNIAASTIATGNGNALEFKDLAIDKQIDLLITNDAVRNANAGAGIVKGSLQFDFSYVNNNLADTFIFWYIFPTDAAGDPVRSDAVQMFDIRNNNGVLRIRAKNDAGSADNIDATVPLTDGADFRLKAEFDCTTRDIIFTLTDLSTNLSALPGGVDTLTRKFWSTNPAFAGMRAFQMYSGTNDVLDIQIDNLIITDDNVTTPAPEVAVSVDSTDVPSGGTVNFGAPAVGVATSKTFTVSNTGAADLTTSNLVLPAGYTLATGETLAATIAASTSDTFVVDLDVATEGVKDGAITFDTNDADEAAYTINVTANVGSTTVEDWQDR